MRFHILAIGALVLALSAFSAQAHELDKETPVSIEQVALAKDLPRTVVVRVKADTQEAEVFESNQLLTADVATKKALADAQFKKLTKEGELVKSELDQDSSTSSWYFWCRPFGYYYYPTYYYYGYTYSYALTYTYYYYGYYYSYYVWPYWR